MKMKAKAISYTLSVLFLSTAIGATSFAASCKGDDTDGTDDCYIIFVMDAKAQGDGCGDHHTFSSSKNSHVYCVNSGARNDRGDPVCSAGTITCSA